LEKYYPEKASCKVKNLHGSILWKYRIMCINIFSPTPAQAW